MAVGCEKAREETQVSLYMRHLLGLRAVGGKLKVQHSILDNLRPLLEKALKSHELKSIIPGSIKPVASAHGKGVRIRVTIPISNGFKVIALADGARQELFVNTHLTAAELKKILIDAGCEGY